MMQKGWIFLVNKFEKYVATLFNTKKKSPKGLSKYELTVVTIFNPPEGLHHGMDMNLKMQI